MKNPITRKEIAAIVAEATGLRISVDQVRRNEIRWGIFKARVKFNGRIFFDEKKAVSELKSNKIIS